MSNPAWALDELLSSWALGNGERVYDARDIASGSTRDEFWRRQAQAVELVQQVEVAIDGLEANGSRMDAFREALNAWYEAVFAPDRDWNQRINGNADAIEPAPRQILRALGAMLDAAYIPDGELAFNELADALDAAEQLIRSEQSLPPAGRAYLLGLIRQAHRYLDDVDAFGTSVLRAATHTIAGALHTAADSGVIPPERTPAWRKAATAVAITVVLPTLAVVGTRLVDKTLPAGPETVVVVEPGSNPPPHNNP